MSTIGDRIKEERDRLDLSQTAFASLAGVGKTTQINYEKNNRSPDTDYLSALDAAGVDTFYVLTGRRLEEQKSLAESGGADDGRSVPLYDVEGAAGAGRSLEHETVIGHFPMTMALINQLDLADARLAGVRVRGDSMEPTLFDGDWTFVNLDDTNWSLGGVFLVWVSGELRIKRVQRLAGGAMYLISDNRHYEPEMIAPDKMQDVAVLGRVRTRLGEIA
ncbi:XRE family transcriptional regulator [Salinicola aestuarinus]|uniref:XRE family transcriptional regulator n=1 Tax=Salinicola aestuarinus TaxID=1949082 RepID=UPI001300B34A|nr:XRE family transcriptional regulator [Salinicola aestuarinus]